MWLTEDAGGVMVGVSGSELHQELLFAFGGGERDVTVALLDGLVDRTHDCFIGAPLKPLNSAAAQRAGEDAPASAQATHLASLLFGQPCRSVEGIAPMCSGLLAPIFSSGRQACRQADLADAIARALDHGADIILIGDGSFERPWYPGPALADAVAKCNARKALIVTSAGSQGCTTLLRRCGTSNLLPVAALDSVGQLLGGQCRDLGDIGIAIPGTSVTGAALEGRIVQRSSPNVAAGMVAGVAAVLLGVLYRAGRARDPGAVAEAIRMTATPRGALGGSGYPATWTGRKSLETAAAYLTGRYEGAYASSLFETWYRAQAGAIRSDHAAFRPRA
ncbi:MULTISPECIES: S8 family serine peptidase [Rhodopseudomonas]|uniref:S8 family serine peptidase n=1 Tax=Rhodopseudomonas TaxID=1073 RepID=UPI001F2C79DE|nr:MULTISPECIES: S8 family serine peptidase [Rhodopseudomonas]